MAVFADRVAAISGSTGAGNMTIGLPVFSYQSWTQGYADGFVYYGILDEATGDWEVGEGTLSAGGTILARDVVIDSSNGGALVGFVAGDKIVYSPEPSTSKNMDQGLF